MENLILIVSFKVSPYKIKPYTRLNILIIPIYEIHWFQLLEVF